MADIFVSYKSDDRNRAGQIARALEGEGFSVWWDPVLQTGQDYQEIIDENLRQSLVVVVLWSKLSAKSRWVRSEATVGDRFGALAPAMIEDCDRPVAFELVQTANLTRWNGDTQDQGWREFVSDVSAKVAQRRQQQAGNSAPPPPDASAIETMFWQSIKDSTDPADFRSYLTRYPSGHFRDLAQNRLAALAGASSNAAATSKPQSTKPNRVALLGTLAAVVIAIIVGAVVLFGRGGPSTSTAQSGGAPAALTAQQAADIAAPLIGRWAPAGLTCADAVSIAVTGAQVSLTYAGGAPSFEAIAGREPNGAIRTTAEGASNFYSILGSTLTLRSPDGSTASFAKCDG